MFEVPKPAVNPAIPADRLLLQHRGNGSWKRVW
jgi:hypothetical protein